jgi:hypothetical protein
MEWGPKWCRYPVIFHSYGIAIGCKVFTEEDMGRILLLSYKK